MSDGVIASEESINASKEPFCEMIVVLFVYGPSRQTYEVKVPMSCLNLEIGPADSHIPRMFPSRNPYTILVQLPDSDIPWVEGIKQFGKYLLPPHKNNKRVTNSPVVPCFLSTNVLVSLYIICRRMHMERLAKEVCNEIEQLPCSQSVAVIQQIVKSGCEGLYFIETLLDKVTSALPTLPAQTFGW